MPSLIEFTLQGEQELSARIIGTADRIEQEIVKSLNTVDTQLQRHIVSDKLSGQVLKSHTGNLKRSIVQIPAERDGDVITGGVGLGAEAPYGLVHEFGATLHIPEIRPVKAKSLHWIGKSGEEVFAMRARAHDVHMPERSFMRSSFADFRDRIEESMREAARRASA
jgi:phage gpG-like protein